MAAKFLPYLLAGISVGGQYALIAIGYTMVYGILRLINFAHGDIFTVAGFLMVYATASLPLTISIPLVVVATVLLGIAVEKIAYKPLRTAPRMSVMISAIGMSYLLQNSMWYVTGGLAKQYPALPWISDTVTVLGCQTKRVTVVTPFLVIVLVAALVTLIQKTKIGMAMRAASRDFETAQLMGDQQCHLLYLCGGQLSCGHRLHDVFFQLHGSHPHCGCDARPESFCGCGVRRHRLHSRCGDRRLHHRHLREPY